MLSFLRFANSAACILQAVTSLSLRWMQRLLPERRRRKGRTLKVVVRYFAWGSPIR
jgi:hypothetical protein